MAEGTPPPRPPPAAKAAAPTPTRRLTVTDIRRLYTTRTPIVMLTAADYPSAVHGDLAGVDITLIGDSLGMVVLGRPTTQTVTVGEMLHHCRAVAAGSARPLLVGDLPFGSYEGGADAALATATRFIKEGSVGAVKLEGGRRSAAAVSALVRAGIAVMGHVGLTPQSVSAVGGFRPAGRDAAGAAAVLDDALAVADAGAFAIVLECVPPAVAAAVVDAVDVPPMGGQVLVYHDVLGMLTHPHHAAVAPRFCKRYADVGDVVHRALVAYGADVRAGAFPSPAYAPYKIGAGALSEFRAYAAKVAAARRGGGGDRPAARIECVVVDGNGAGAAAHLPRGRCAVRVARRGRMLPRPPSAAGARVRAARGEGQGRPPPPPSRGGMGRTSEPEELWRTRCTAVTWVRPRCPRPRGGVLGGVRHARDGVRP
ncbi:hypothetical protein BU14_0229s0024 [Porphyra umbilicalis]|uniref:3-methyl-2-oxobutanoate hydroxymethyltransferase n=1 Tax=Porphyra umbilicalis TaxID=2786 RepID=A0A1X6P4D2_PORUM|nr:hypothetical protein BU14_0229s0024 [Porphyra umbilicalis]|eukprot:OSX75636.1 hypothetical protein BU14_0229s0024 [Porphyra umbilicalis]